MGPLPLPTMVSLRRSDAWVSGTDQCSTNSYGPSSRRYYRFELARYDLRHVTEVEAGENNGKTLTNHHVVREFRDVGSWTGKPLEIHLADIRLGLNEGCAVIVQAHDQGAILGAAPCPS